MLFFSQLAEADVLQLIDGRAFKGEIIEQDDLQVVIKDEQGRINRFYKEQIKNIVEGDLQTPITVDPAQFANIAADKTQLIIRLLEANGTRKSLERNIQDTLSKVPAKQKAGFEKLLNLNEIVAELIPVYDKHFSQEEIVAMSAFYESEAGQKMISVAPDLIEEAAKATLGYFQKKLTSQ